MAKRAYLPALLWKRIFAFIIDLMVLDLFILSPFKDALSSHLSGISFSSVFSGKIAVSKDIVTLMLTLGLFAMLYFAILEYKLGQSVGKILLNLTVVSTEGATLTFWRCVFRSLFLIPLFPIIILWVLDPIYMFFDANNQRLLERWSKTMTVQVMPPAWYKVKYNEIPTE